MNHRSEPGTAPAIAAAWDAIVVGGGPAGSAAALSLARAGRRVLLVERRARRGFRLGESIPPAVRPLVETLLGDVAGTVGVPTHGNVSCWGRDEPAEQSFVFSPYGHGLRLDRARFDHALRRRAEAAGAVVREGVGVSRIAGFSDSRIAGGEPWELEIGGEVHRARFLVDCSGRNALVARHCGARRQTSDRLFAFARVFEADHDPDTLTRIEATPQGWWYTARLPAGSASEAVQRIVVFHTDRDLPAARRAATAEGFDELLAESRHVGPLLRRHGYAIASREDRTTPRGAPAGGERFDRFAGPGWIAAGDAAQAFDPLSSQGIGKALSSGRAAAAAVGRALGGSAPDGTRDRAQDDPLERYDAEQESIHAEYLRQHRRFYAAEGRWPREPFWSRRRREPPAATSRQTHSPGAGEDARAPRLQPSPSSSSTPPLPTRLSKESPCVP